MRREKKTETEIGDDPDEKSEEEDGEREERKEQEGRERGTRRPFDSRSANSLVLSAR